jgi:Muramidase (flagellum-specific)
MKQQIGSFFVFLLLLFQVNTLFAQSKQQACLDYIEKYNSLAIEHMEKYSIPASIKLAQGLLESGAGRSELAKGSNNHFGIKCHKDWTGSRVFRADDGPNDCFRVYSSVDHCYEDHSTFLLRPRYSSLFEYDITDYKKWAKGLQKCGYATDKGYANKLINMIELYELHQYDKGGYKGKNKKKKNKSESSVITKHRPVIKERGLQFIRVEAEDSLDAIAWETGKKKSDLMKFNEIHEDFSLQEGDIIYLQKKKSKADKPFFDHEVQVGESMHSISQKYGIKVKDLYKLNGFSLDYIPTEGDVIRLR